MFLPGDPCIVCAGAPQKEETISKLIPSKIESIEDLSFIPKDRNPISQTNVWLCTLCSQMLVCRYSTLVLNDPDVEIPRRYINTPNCGEVIKFPITEEENCPFCKDLKSLVK